MMRMNLPIIALAALAALLSGCGCSKEKKSVEGIGDRMADVAYTNALANLRHKQTASAAKISGIMTEIEKLGKNASLSPKYASLTNDLAKCRAELEAARRATQMAVRSRLMQKNASAKGNLKK
jgi:hypothetical protein